MSLALSEVEIAWLAGLFEGEGSFGLDKRSSKRYKVSTSPPQPFCKIAMTDEDIIKRVGRLLNRLPFSPTVRLNGQDVAQTRYNKQVYVVSVGDRETLDYFLPKILPYMGERRTKQIQPCINAIEEWKLWRDQGGTSKMAKYGGIAKAKAMAKKKLLIPKSDIIDMESLDK